MTGNEGLGGDRGHLWLDRIPRSAVPGFVEGKDCRFQLAEAKHLLPAMPFFSIHDRRQTTKQALQAEQLAACNRLHSVEHRLARWLIMLHNRNE